jgi:UDP-D-galactose:(glucosyl)LPS alpha-1,6-D-galactosyltransferase
MFMRIHIASLQMSGRGGMETVFRLIDEELVRRGHDVQWLLPDPPIHAEWASAFGERVSYFLPNSRITTDIFVELALGLQRTVAELPPADAVVLAASRNLALYPLGRLALGHQSRIPLVGWQHMTVADDPYANFIRLADAHLALTDDLAREIATIDPGKPTTTILNPIAGIGSRIIPRPAVPTFVWMGRLNDPQHKRPDRFLRALAGLRPGSFRAVIVGANDAQEAEPLRSLAQALNIAPALTWVYWQENPWDHIAEATALVLTSDREGLPLVLAEALGRGIPVISTDCPVGPRTIIQPGVNGYLCALDDGASLKTLLAQIIDGSRPLPDADTCIQSVARFRPEAVAAAFENALAALVG